MTHDEIRERAWQRLWKDQWFGRLLGGSILLGLCGHAMNVIVGGLLGRLNVASWQEYLEAVMKNRADVASPIPVLTNDYIYQATSSQVLVFFLSFIMAGIAAYGGAVILRKCLDNDESGWLGESFGGFRTPFGMLWLFFRRCLINLGWGVLAGIPVGVAVGIVLQVLKRADVGMGLIVVLSVFFSLACALSLVIALVPFYRYRYLWLVKAEHPDWSAGACLRACKSLMRGCLMRAVRLDCAYWKPIAWTLALAVVCVSALSAAVGGVLPFLTGAVAFFAFCATVVASVVCTWYVGVGQGFLYRELLAEQAESENKQKGIES